MIPFSQNINQAFEAFYAKDYQKACATLKTAYSQLAQSGFDTAPAPYYLEKGMAVMEELIQLPEIEITDYIADILAHEKAALAHGEHPAFLSRTNTIQRVVALLQDLENLMVYWDEYLGGMNHSDRPVISVALEAEGQYALYENIYQSKSTSGNP